MFPLSLRTRLLRPASCSLGSRLSRALATCSHDSHRDPDLTLRIYNSLTKSKTPLTDSGGGKPLKWYSCGPTVYDSAHLGHARYGYTWLKTSPWIIEQLPRNYVSQDIIRRVLVDYFGYNVHYVMNVTDIDDKIIARTRENHFVEKLCSMQSELSPALLAEIEQLLKQFIATRIPSCLPQDSSSEQPGLSSRISLEDSVHRIEQDTIALQRNDSLKGHISSAKHCLEALAAAQFQFDSGQTSKEYAVQLILRSKDVLGPVLNAKFHSEAVDSRQVSQTAAFWEARFFDSMERLNVLPPDSVTRASEYVSEIINFIEGILGRGYGYVSNGSVYFDTRAFSKSGEHQYGKLVANSTQPQEVNNAALDYKNDKKSATDFALWKAVKAGEPSWPSPWGAGRPGWHIECSAMASSIFGSHMDIHSGGIDLMFPHHTNELAQSEAYHGCHTWVDCFIHMGHLHIDGHKMSKSLKNFITIEDLLKRYSARQIRLAFLLRPWGSRLDYSDAMMTQEVLPLETSLKNFFSHVSSLSLDSAALRNGCTFGARERQLRSEYDNAKAKFHRALCDSVNTPAAISVIRTLISQTNVYLNQSRDGVDGFLVLAISRWIARMFTIFGLDASEASHPIRAIPGVVESDGIPDKSALLPYIQALSLFRDDVRRVAKEGSPGMRRELLTICDRMRDGVLPSIGVKLVDRADGPAFIKFIEPQTNAVPQPKHAQVSETGSRQATTAQKARLDRRIINPCDMFKHPHTSGQYGSWDELGVPLTDANGLELSKNHRKRLQKEWNVQKAIHEQYQGSN